MKKRKGQLIPGSNPSGNPHAIGQIMASHTQFTRQGPIPPPEDMERYAALRPDLVDRIMGMAEREATHRHQYLTTEQSHENRLITFDGTGMLLGMIFALIIGLAGIAGAVACILQGHELGGGLLGFGALGGIVSTFIVGHRMRQAKQEKNPA